MTLAGRLSEPGIFVSTLHLYQLAVFFSFLSWSFHTLMLLIDTTHMFPLWFVIISISGCIRKDWSLLHCTWRGDQ
jgi:hypothetical protein